jgi:hypothetical protein
MSSDVLSQTFFGVYEFFANIIPGTLILVTAAILFLPNFPITIPNNTLVIESLWVIVFAFVAFIIGLAIQGASAFLEKRINKRKYGDYPSSVYLTKENDTFPEYFKTRIRNLVNKKFGTPVDATSSHIFDICYTYVMQKNISERVPQFLRTYTFSRNMVVTGVIEAALLFVYAFNQQQIWFVLGGFGFLVLSYIFYSRFIRYGESFAKEVLRSFFVNEEQK